MLAACVFALWPWCSLVLPLVLFIYSFQDKYSKEHWVSFRTLPIYSRVLWSLPCSDKFFPVCVDLKLLGAGEVDNIEDKKEKKSFLFGVFDVICDFIWASWAAPRSRLGIGAATFGAKQAPQGWCWSCCPYCPVCDLDGTSRTCKIYPLLQAFALHCVKIPWQIHPF